MFLLFCQHNCFSRGLATSECLFCSCKRSFDLWLFPRNIDHIFDVLIEFVFCACNIGKYLCCVVIVVVVPSSILVLQRFLVCLTLLTGPEFRIWKSVLGRLADCLSLKLSEKVKDNCPSICH